jgi:transposase
MYMSTSARQIGYREKRDALWDENKRLKMTIAIYECDNNIAALNDFYEKKIRGIEAREKRNYDSWMNAVSVNKDLKAEISSLSAERDNYRLEAKRHRNRREFLEKENGHLRDLVHSTAYERDELKTSNDEKDRQINALKEEICRLKARIDHDGTTSGIPTSQTPRGKKKVVPNGREKSGKKKGGQKGHKKHSMQAFEEEEISHTEEHTLDACPHCRGRLEKLPEDPIEKDETDYEVHIIKKRHRYPKYRCTKCGKTVRAKIREELKEENQYGPNILALTLALVDMGFVSIGRTKDIVCGFLGKQVKPSVGLVGKVQKKAARRLKKFRDEVKDHCIQQRVLHWDDTVIFMNQNRACMRFYGTDKIACFFAHKQKDAEGIEADGILSRLTEKTYLMHDHLKYNYRKEFLFHNIECTQHLERDLESVFRDSGHKWAGEFKELISGTIHKRKQYLAEGKEKFTDEDTNIFEEKMEQILVKGYKEFEKDKGRYFQDDERRLLTRINEYRENYFAWVYDFTLPTTNNIAEAGLRMTKTKLKVSGQFLKEETADEFALVRTYTETCRRNGVNEYEALRRLMAGNPYTLEEILSVTP